ncbi:hypothetical protein AB0J82_36510 [Asanoa sp. NPDC049518]|uniref:hypothetical protein n=1 Tax=unclassified Asanoa TaxID=2685164 RepID=UPI003440C0AE
MAANRSSNGDPAGAAMPAPDQATVKGGVAVAVPAVGPGASSAATPLRVSVHFGQPERIRQRFTDDELDVVLASGTRWAWFFVPFQLVMAVVLITWVVATGQASRPLGESPRGAAVVRSFP